MIRPDAIPVSPQRSSLCVAPGDVAMLFGRGHALRGTERVALVRLGHHAGHAAVTAGTPALRVDSATDNRLGGRDGVRVVGPCGSIASPPVSRVETRLILPSGLRRAWGVGDAATLALGAVAMSADVIEGAEASVTTDHGLWLAAGQPATARWLPGISWAATAMEPALKINAITGISRRVVTETDVRQARLRGQRIRLAPGQIVTPAARSLAKEWDVFADDTASAATAPSAPRRA